MKRYISAVLIPCLLLQIWGCSYNTYSEINLEKLKNYDGSSKIKIKTSQDEFIIGETSGKFETKWEFGDSSVIVMRSEIFRGNIRIPIDTTQIKYSNIQKIEIEESEKLSGWVIAGTVVLSLAIIGLGIAYIIDSFSKNFWK